MTPATEEICDKVAAKSITPTSRAFEIGGRSISSKQLPETSGHFTVRRLAHTASSRCCLSGSYKEGESGHAVLRDMAQVEAVKQDKDRQTAVAAALYKHYASHATIAYIHCEIFTTLAYAIMVLNRHHDRCSALTLN